jgi:pimeloyl-ACP methyl ester carboxylesterase
MKALALTGVALGVACGNPGLAPISYRADSAWLCLPGRADPCARDLTTVDVRPDGSRGTRKPPPAPGGIDCFYIYPTVDDSPRVGNHTDFTDRSAIAQVTAAQAMQFRQVCDLYVPLYRQITMGTYAHDDEWTDQGLATAYGDVAAAFTAYLAAHPDHGIVLIGHSQGAEMITRLLKDRFDRDPKLRARLVLALVLGGNLDVAVGQRTGGTFANLPMCGAAGETGCVIAYRSIRAGGPIAQPDPGYPAGREQMCVNPGNLTDSAAIASLSAVYLDEETYTTYFGLYRARCVRTADRARMLAIEEVPVSGAAVRKSPIDLNAPELNTTFGTHVFDVGIAEATLIELVRRASSTWKKTAAQ